MAEYWGLKSISARMQWKYERSAYRAFLSVGFPIYRRKKKGRIWWYSEDAIIMLWQLQRVKQDREKELARITQKSKAVEAIPEGNVQSDDAQGVR